MHESRRRSDSTLFVPEIVVDEVEANFGKRLEEAVKEAINATQSLARLIDGEYKIPELAKPEEMARYSKRFRSRLKALQTGVRHYPSIFHPVLVKRQVDHQRPFQASGAGYRDALIWHSLLELLKGAKDDCVLVTKNSEDSSASKEFATILHSELQKDLDAFLDEHAKPTLKKLDDLKRNLKMEN